jgi:hypothetical protein
MTPILPQYQQQLNQLANTLDSLQLNPNVLKNKKINTFINRNDLDNVINDWHWLLSKLTEDEALIVESAFFKPHWIPVEANTYEWFVDLSDDKLPLAEYIFNSSNNSYYIAKRYNSIDDIFIEKEEIIEDEEFDFPFESDFSMATETKDDSSTYGTTNLNNTITQVDDIESDEEFFAQLNALRVISKNYYNDNLLSLCLRHSDFMIDLLSSYYPLANEVILQHRHLINFYNLGKNTNISKEDKITLFDIIGDDGILEDVKLNDSSNQSTDEVIDLDSIHNPNDWFNIAYNPNVLWNEEAIDKYRHSWENKTNTDGLSEGVWYALSDNTKMNWSIHLIEKYANFDGGNVGWDWEALSQNPSLPWNIELIDTYSQYWHWDKLSINTGIPFTFELIEKFEKNFIWFSGKDNLSSNIALPWSREFIQTYDKYWNVNYLVANEGITWDDDMIEEYRKKSDINFEGLFKNPSVQWTLPLILKYEEQCFESWKYCDDEIKKSIYDKAFAPLLSDEKVANIFETLANPVHLFNGGIETGLGCNDFNNFVELAINLFQLNDSAFKTQKHFSEAEKIVQILQRSIVKLANSKKGSEVKDYTSIEGIFNSVSDQQKEDTKILLQPIKGEIIRVLEEQDIDVHEMRGIIERHKSEMETYRDFRRNGGYIRFNFNYLHDYIEKVGEKELTLGRILFAVEQLNEPKKE